MLCSHSALVLALGPGNPGSNPDYLTCQHSAQMLVRFDADSYKWNRFREIKLKRVKLEDLKRLDSTGESEREGHCPVSHFSCLSSKTRLSSKFFVQEVKVIFRSCLVRRRRWRRRRRRQPTGRRSWRRQPGAGGRVEMFFLHRGVNLLRFELLSDGSVDSWWQHFRVSLPRCPECFKISS